MGIYAAVAGGALSGDFAYRQLLVDGEWHESHASLWFRWGTAGGSLPVQELFDVSLEGGLTSVPIRRFRSKTLLTAGVEGRILLDAEIAPAGFITATKAPGDSPGIIEMGISLIVLDEKGRFGGDDWSLRFDIPFYSRGAQLVGARDDWDLRRFMVELNLPLIGFDPSHRHDIIRYRYPNR
jgi:hypothetical protein